MKSYEQVAAEHRADALEAALGLLRQVRSEPGPTEEAEEALDGVIRDLETTMSDQFDLMV